MMLTTFCWVLFLSRRWTFYHLLQYLAAIVFDQQGFFLGECSTTHFCFSYEMLTRRAEIGNFFFEAHEGKVLLACGRRFTAQVSA